MFIVIENNNERFAVSTHHNHIMLFFFETYDANIFILK